MMESQALVDTASPNSQDRLLAKPGSSIPQKHSIDYILKRAGQKRTHQEIDESTRDTQESTGK